MNLYAIIVLVAIAVDYLLSVVSSLLNLRSLDPALPAEFRGVFDADTYARSQEYTRVRTRFQIGRSTFMVAVLLVWWQLGGFGWLDRLVRSFDVGPIGSGLAYIGALATATAVIGLPFRLHSTFGI